IWLAQTISFFGDRITLLALPLTAVLTLGATPLQMGVLAAAGSVPILLVGLVAGAWIDRFPRKPVLVATDIGRAILLGMIPLAALAGGLRIEWLYVVAFFVGILSVFSGLAGVAFLPLVISRDRLVQANSSVEASRSVAQIAGPGIAGVLVQL